MPHSDIRGSKLIRSSPRLFAAYHVLRRLCVPRHSPDALNLLDHSHRPCPFFLCSRLPTRRGRQLRKARIASNPTAGRPREPEAGSIGRQPSTPLLWKERGTWVMRHSLDRYRKHAAGRATRTVRPAAVSFVPASSVARSGREAGERPASRDGTRQPAVRQGRTPTKPPVPRGTRPNGLRVAPRSRALTGQGDEPRPHPEPDRTKGSKHPLRTRSSRIRLLFTMSKQTGSRAGAKPSARCKPKPSFLNDGPPQPRHPTKRWS